MENIWEKLQICGLVCVGIGIWLMLDKYAVDNLAAATAKVQGHEKNAGLRDLATKPQAVRQIGTLLTVGGIIVIFVAFLGCCGAAKEWRPLLCCVRDRCSQSAAHFANLLQLSLRKVDRLVDDDDSANISRSLETTRR